MCPIDFVYHLKQLKRSKCRPCDVKEKDEYTSLVPNMMFAFSFACLPTTFRFI
jgi:hypothetical protein